MVGEQSSRIICARTSTPTWVKFKSVLNALMRSLYLHKTSVYLFISNFKSSLCLRYVYEICTQKLQPTTGQWVPGELNTRISKHDILCCLLLLTMYFLSTRPAFPLAVLISKVYLLPCTVLLKRVFITKTVMWTCVCMRASVYFFN